MQGRTASLPKATALLSSRDPSLVEELRGHLGMVRKCKVEVCETVTQARTALGQNGTALLLVHVGKSGDEAEVTRLLGDAMPKRSCPAIILSDTYEEQQAAAFLRAGAADYLGRPLDHGKLACLMDILLTRAVLAARGAATPPPPPPGRPRGAALSPPLLPRAGMIGLMDQLRPAAPRT